MVEPWVGCKATQIKCGQIPNGNDLLNLSSLRSHLLPYSECALATLLRHTHPDLTCATILILIQKLSDQKTLNRLAGSVPH